MALEEPLKDEPTFYIYNEVRKIADKTNLAYFKKWFEIIQLEQSAVNVNAHSTLNVNERKAIKDEGLKIQKIEFHGTGEEFTVWLERPYYSGGRVNTEITENSFINLHTTNSISFTKGLVLKKHLITKPLP